MSAFDSQALQPLDFVLYRPSGIYGRLIRFHTGHNISHVEVALGNGRVTASRDGQGVGFYPVRTDHVAYVMRPVRIITARQLSLAQRYARAMVGTPYGWLDLLAFFGFNINARGIVCSPYAAAVARMAEYELFNNENLRYVAPFEFRTNPLLRVVWTDGLDAPIDDEPV